MREASPFAVLGIAPTRDRATIKRAYFGLLPRHPPHSDPEGFRRLRGAYETLLGPELLEAWARAPVDIEAELAVLPGELGDRIERAQLACESDAARRAAVASFEGLLRLDLASARARIRA